MENKLVEQDCSALLHWLGVGTLPGTRVLSNSVKGVPRFTIAGLLMHRVLAGWQAWVGEVALPNTDGTGKPEEGEVTQFQRLSPS
jgi:hypothetical protein